MTDTETTPSITTTPTPASRRTLAHRRRPRTRLLVPGAVTLIAAGGIALAVTTMGGGGGNKPAGHVDAADQGVPAQRAGATAAVAGGPTSTAVPRTAGATTVANPVLHLTLDGYGGYAIVDARDASGGIHSVQATCRPVPPPATGACQQELSYPKGDVITLHLETTPGPWPSVTTASGPCNLTWDTATQAVPPQECSFTLTSDASVVVTWSAAEREANGQLTTWKYPTCPVYTHPKRAAPAPCH